MIPIIQTVAALGSKVIDIVGKHVSNKDEREKLTIEIQKEYVKALAELQSQLLKSQSEIIVSEATGHSWLQRNWRPITMLVFVSIIANNFIIVPYAQALFGASLPVLHLPNEVWELIKQGLVGYIGARTGEKIVTSYIAAKQMKDVVKQTIQQPLETMKVPKVKDINLTLDDVE